MATFNIIAQSGTSNVSAALTSTKVKVVSNVACYYAVGSEPVAYNSGNCFILPANTIRDINVGPGTLITDANLAVTLGGVGPKIAFLTTGGTALVAITEVGFVDFTKVTN